MRKILYLLFLLVSFGISAQVDDCTTAPPATPTTADAAQTFISSNIAFSDEGNWTSSSLAGPISGFHYIMWSSPTGFYSMDISASSAGPWSIALSPDVLGNGCTIADSEELFEGMLNDGDELTCFYFENGVSYYIGYATDAGNEGSFTFEFVTPSIAPPTNAACATAEMVGTAGVIATDCVAEAITGDLLASCPNPEEVMCLDLGSSNVLWYTFTTDAFAEEITITDITGAFTPQFALLTGACGSQTIEGTCQDDGMETYPVSTNTTYWLAVGQENGMTGGIFDIEIEASSTPVNDDCVAALGISSTPTDGTTTCATAPDFAFCGLGGTDHGVYYTYTVAGTDPVDLDFDFNANTNLAPIGAANLSMEILTDCASGILALGTPAAGDNCDVLSGTVSYTCVPPGDYTIFVGSTNGNAGGFDIAVTENAIVGLPANNSCMTADNSVALNTNCTVATINGDNTNACPEVFTGECDYTNNAVTWHQITMPVEATGLIFDNLVGTIDLTFFSDDVCPPSAIVDCFDGTEAPYTVNTAFLTPGNTYNIAVTSPMGSEGPYSFDVLAIVPPSNDICDPDAEAFTPMGGAVEGTTACATPPTVDFCALGTTNSHVVYYTYTVQSATSTNLDIIVAGSTTNGPAATDISVALYTDCLGTTYDNPEINAADGCSTLGTTLEYECVAPGTILTIAVGSPDMSEGGFTIDILEDNIGIHPEDACSLPGPLVLPTDCTALVFDEDNTNSCVETFTFGACNFTTNNVIFYSFTLPVDATGVEFTGVDNNEIISLHEGLTCPPASIVDGDCIFGDDIITGLTAGSDYLLAVTLDGGAVGPIQFEILAIIPPANDECAGGTYSAEDISATAAGGVAGTNLCANADGNVCGLDATTSHVVWYEYTLSNTVSVDLEINVTGSGATAATDVSVQAYTDCAYTDLDNSVMPCPVAIGNDIIYECVNPDLTPTIYIAVGSADGTEGDFTITINETNPAPSNDLCSGAEDIIVTGACTWIPVNTNNTDACPETPALDGVSSCDLDMDAVVWNQITLPGSGVGLGFQTLSADAYVAVFSGDCDNLVLEDDCLTADGQILNLTGGNTYYIASAQTAGAEGAISYEIRVITPAVNDICDPDAIALTSGVQSQGTTACATPDLNGYCGLNTTNSHTVYYTYTVTSIKNTQVTIDIASSDLSTGTMAGDIYLGVWTDCNGTDFAVDPVDDTGAALDECNADVDQTLIYNCVPPGTVLTIAVGSTDPMDGDFAITVTEDDSGTPDNDLCSAPQDEGVIDPPCEFIDITTSSVGACPETFDFASDCGFDDWPIVWVSVTTPAGAASIELVANNADVGTPLYALFEDGPDCTNLVNVSDCFVGFAATDPIPVNENQTYLVGIGVQNAAGSDNINFSIKVNVPPANDDPCDAEVLAAGVATLGTNSCATADFTDPNCPMDQGDASVWYTYTLAADETGVEITFPSITADGPINAFVVDYGADCTSAPTFIDNDATTCDAASLTEPLVLNCIDPNTQIWIGVASEDANAGEFEIQIDPIITDPLCVDNDECDMAQDEGVITTDDDCATISDCNANACAEDIGCGVEVNNVVWYSVTNDGLGEFISAGVENADFDEPVISIFSGGCGALTLVGPCEFGSGGVANAGPFMIPADGTQYWIAVGSSGAVGGDFDLCIEINSGCVNDDPCSGVELTDGVPVDNPASTVGCTMDITNPDCPDQLHATVYYTFVVPPGAGAFQVQVENNATSGIGGNIGIMVGPYSDGICNGLNADDNIFTSCIAGDQNHTIPCTPEGGEYYIQIASLEGLDEGDFTITVTALTPAQSDPIAPENDICSGVGVDDMFEISDADYCQYVANNSTTTGACPELFFSGGCMYNENPTVWMSIEVPNDPDITTMDVLLEDVGGLTNPMLAVITIDCTDPLNTGVEAAAGSGCIQGDAGMAEMIGIDVTPGETYYFVVSSSTGAEGDFSLSVQLDVPPENDNPCPTDDNPPIDLSGGGSHAGTTCCARGANDDPAFDWANQECAGITDDDAVWYTFTPSGADDGFIVEVTGGGGPNGISGNTTVEVYSSPDPNGGCTNNLTAVGSSCASLPAEIQIPVCDDALTYYVKIASQESNCGDFDISITDRSICDMADECDELGAAQLLGSPLMTDESFAEIFEECIPGCLGLACPEDPTPPGDPCVFADNPTVWIEIETDDIAAQLFTSVTTSGTWTPVWSIYYGPDCDNLTQISSDATPPCSNGDDTPDLHQTQVPSDDDGNTITTFYVAVSGEGVIDDPMFEICAYTTINAIVCLGDITDNCNADPTVMLEVTEREFADGVIDPDGDGVAGPFCQGEEISIHLEYFYDASETGVDWLIGMIPEFGEGYNLEDFDYAGNAPAGSEWIEEDGPCAPLIQEPVPHLCTYENDDGNLVLCNSLCQSCPCTPGMVPDDPLPSGWFWLSNGGGGCANDCSPGTMYGIGSTTSQISFDFTITVGEFMDAMECAQNNDLQISFQTFSDGVAGCWEDPVGECLIDRKQFGPLWKIECEQAPGVIATPQPREICNGGSVDIEVVTDDGSATQIEITVVDNPNVNGEMDHIFPSGFGTVDDILTLEPGVTTPQVVTYTAFTTVPELICPGIPQDFEVTVYPQLEVEFNEPLVVCDGESIEIIPTGIGGTGNYVDYQWGSNAGNATTPTVTVTPVTTTTYCVTITDDLGCTGNSCVEVFYNPPVEFDLVPTQTSVCQNGVEEQLLMIEVDITSGTGPFNIDWSDDVGFNLLDYELDNNAFNNGKLTVNEESSEAGFYTITVFIEDNAGCFSEEEIEIEIGQAPFINTNPFDIPCGGSGEPIQIITSAFPVGSTPISTMSLTDCDGILIYEVFGNSAVWEVDPNDFDCIIIVATDQNGCIATEEYMLDTNAGPEPEVTGANHCVGATSTVSVVDEANYTDFAWNSGEMTSSITADRDTNFIYVVTVTDINGCTGATSLEVVVNDSPVVSLAGSLSFCEGSNTTLTASGGSSYVWTTVPGGAEVSTLASVMIDMAGDYNVLVTNADGCTKDSTVTVISDDNLNVTLNDLLLCDGDVDTLSAGESFATYMWEDAAGTSLGSDYFVEVGAGTYCVTVTDASGCTGETCKEVLANQSPTADVTPFIEVCREDNGIGSTSIDFTAQVNSGTGTWVDLNVSNVDLTDLMNVDFDGIARDTYYFEFRTNTAMAPCTNDRDTMCVAVINCDCPSVDLLGPVTLCNVDGTTYDLDDRKNTLEDGTWSLSTGNPLPPLTGSIVDLAGAPAGEYFFTFTLDNPVGTCPTTNETSLIVVEEAVVGTVDNIVCNADTGNGPTTIDLNVTLTTGTTPGGVWTDATGAVVDPPIVDGTSITPNTELVFTYTVTGTTPCEDVSDDVTITVIDCDCPQFPITDPDPLCNDDDSITLDDFITTTEPGTWAYVSGGTGGAVPLEAGNVFNAQGLSSGLYVYEFTLDNDPGGDCENTGQINIIVSNQPAVTTLGEGAPCNEDTGAGPTTVDLTQLISGSTTGTWMQTSGTLVLDLSVPSNVDFAGGMIGEVYTIDFTTTTAAIPPCANVTTTVIVTIQNCLCPNIDVLEPAPLCNTTLLDLATLEGPMIGDGNWSVAGPDGPVSLGGPNGTELDVNGITAGDYSLTYTLDPVPSGNCQPDSTVVLTVADQLFATLASDMPVCVNDGNNGANFINFNSLVIAGFTGGTWEDTDDSGVDLSNLDNVSFEGITPDAAFTFTYVVDSADPCMDNTYTIVINTNPCDCPLATPLNPADECSATGVVDLSQYDNAQFPGTWSSTTLTVTGNTVDLTDVDAGVYVLSYTMDDPVDGCQDTWDVNLNVINPANAGTALEELIFCEDESEIVDLFDRLDGEDGSGMWMETSGVMSTGGAFNTDGTFDITGQAVGTYSFEYMITGNDPCPAVSETVVVTIESVPEALAGEDQEIDCNVTSAMIGGSSTTGPNITYTWTEASGTQIANADQPVITVMTAGVYTLLVEDSETGCASMDEVIVTVSDDVPSFMVELSDVSCNGANDGTINIVNPTGGNGDYVYSFNGGAFGTETSFTNLGPGDYTIVMEDTSGSGCTSEQTVTILEPALLVLDLGPPQNVTIGDIVVFTIEDQLGNFEIDNIVWTVDGVEFCSSPTCTSITLTAEDNANVDVTVTYNGGCIATSSSQVLVTRVVDVILPNVISPNGDNNNDVFYVNSDDVELVLSTLIYDRWGELVFVSSNHPAQDPIYGWNGTFKGEPVNPGVFVYVVEILYKGGAGTETFSGDVTIVR